MHMEWSQVKRCYDLYVKFYTSNSLIFHLISNYYVYIVCLPVPNMSVCLNNRLSPLLFVGC